MKKFKIVCALTLLATLSVSVCALAKKTNKPVQSAPHNTLGKADKDGFYTLFNGKNLSGWFGSTDKYSVKDGVMHCKKGAKGMLLHRQRFDDFHLKFDFKLTPGANNGLAIRAPKKGDPANTAMELQILDNSAAKYANLKPYQYHGSVYGLVPAKKGALKKVGEWNHQEVIAEGTKLKVILNGEVILEADLAEKVKGHTGKIAKNCAKRIRGFIGWANHGDELFFRNIKIKPIDTYAKGEHNIAPKGFKPLFNGKDLTGWKGRPHYSPYKFASLSADKQKAEQKKWNADMRKHWTVKDGAIVNDGKGVFLTTNKKYKDFELLIDYKTVAKADSGIYLRDNPQVQIWDYTKAGRKWHYGADKGSGGLWNNTKNARFPKVLADKPFGMWNRMRIKLVGDKVSVWLNGELVVDNVTMENYFNRRAKLFDSGHIQLQTHGGEIQWRNVFIKELPRKK